ncbi:hypothetical protein [Larkinella soli]|uniref:hypothetical protein n=1 Tax=Larkinella soli TaxID=1770527 RepID=UPI000FFB2500|nr:hypothetical protein [Larkinella soli]
MHYYRQGDAIHRQTISAAAAPEKQGIGLPVPLLPKPASALPVAGSPAGIPYGPMAPNEPPAPGLKPVRPRTTGLDGLNWFGVFLSGVALLLLINAGGEARKGGIGHNPKLIDSLWGIAAAVLLVVELIYFSIGASRFKLRTNFWGIVVCTVFASFILKSCDGYQADKVADGYTILLGLLMLVVYFMPRQRGR